MALVYVEGVAQQLARFGHKPSAVVTFGFQEAGLAPIRLSGRFPATNLSPALARPGHQET
ncbi:MAG: hypothetical protein JSR64_02665 [Nitrospira sp.]|nr:hypothetical protein [Nitrospira sp.]